MSKPDSTDVTFSEVYKDFKGAIDAIAESLKIGSQHVYEVLVRQQFVESISLLLLFLGLGIASFICFRTAISMKKKSDEEYSKNYRGTEDWDQTIAFIPLVFGLVLSIGTIVGICIEMDTIITGFVNPEYGAIMEIKDFIK